MDERNQFQLLPGTKKRLGIKVPGENKFLYIGSAILGATLVIIFAINNYESSLMSQVKQLNDQIFSIEQKRNKGDEANLRATKDRLSLTHDIIDKHVYWSQGFSWFGSMLQNEIQIRSIVLANDGKFNFLGTAANYAVLAKQIASLLSDEKITDLTIGKIEATSVGTIDFGIDLKLNLPGIIYK